MKLKLILLRATALLMVVVSIACPSDSKSNNKALTDKTNSNASSELMKVGYIQGSNVNMRDQGSLSGKRLNKLNLYEEVEVLGKSEAEEDIKPWGKHPWMKIKTKGGHEGYVFGGLLSTNRPTIYIARDKVVLRKDASLESDKLDNLDTNAEVEFISKSEKKEKIGSMGEFNWVKVKTKDGKEGYIFGALLSSNKIEKPAAPPAPAGVNKFYGIILEEFKPVNDLYGSPIVNRALDLWKKVENKAEKISCLEWAIDDMYAENWGNPRKDMSVFTSTNFSEVPKDKHLLGIGILKSKAIADKCAAELKEALGGDPKPRVTELSLKSMNVLYDDKANAAVVWMTMGFGGNEVYLSSENFGDIYIGYTSSYNDSVNPDDFSILDKTTNDIVVLSSRSSKTINMKTGKITDHSLSEEEIKSIGSSIPNAKAPVKDTYMSESAWTYKNRGAYFVVTSVEDSGEMLKSYYTRYDIEKDGDSWKVISETELRHDQSQVCSH